MAEKHEILKNGAMLIARKRTAGGHIVLAKSLGSYQPFVTWHENSEGFTGQGHYFTEIADAVKDYTERR